jgi:hypothetical protein
MLDNSDLLSLPCLRLYELVALTPACHRVRLGANCSVPLVDSKEDKAGYLIELVRSPELSRLAIRSLELLCLAIRSLELSRLVIRSLELSRLAMRSLELSRLAIRSPELSCLAIRSPELLCLATKSSELSRLVIRSFTGDFTAGKQDAVGLRTPVTTIQVL